MNDCRHVWDYAYTRKFQVLDRAEWVVEYCTRCGSRQDHFLNPEHYKPLLVDQPHPDRG